MSESDEPTRVYSAEIADRHADKIRAAGGILVDLDEVPGSNPAVLLRTVGRAPPAAFIDALRSHDDIVWMHTVAAGVDDLNDVVPAHVTLTRTPGPAGAPVADYALAAVLGLVRGFTRLSDAQREHRWSKPFRSKAFDEITVVILGWGAIGRAIADRLRCLGSAVHVVRRQPVPDQDPPQHGPGELHELLVRADALVVACASTKETTGIVDSDAIEAIGSGGVLVNVSRAAVVDQAALVSALRSGALFGAVTDVTHPEPLDPTSDLWDVPGLLITPHLAGFAGQSTADEVIAIFCDNLRRFRAAQPLRHVVDRERGY